MRKNRIKEIKRMRIGDLNANAKNWRTHPDYQKRVVNDLLDQVGVADVVLAYVADADQETGKLTLIDGHLRQEEDPEQIWDVAVLDVNDAEADMLLATIDRSVQLAGVDSAKVVALTEGLRADGFALRDLLEGAMREAKGLQDNQDEDQEKTKAGDDGKIPEMELGPFEHYDYILLLFKSTLDFDAVCDKLGIQKESFIVPGGVRDGGKEKTAARKIGTGRAIDGAKAMEILCSPQ